MNRGVCISFEDSEFVNEFIRLRKINYRRLNYFGLFLLANASLLNLSLDPNDETVAELFATIFFRACLSFSIIFIIITNASNIISRQKKQFAYSDNFMTNFKIIVISLLILFAWAYTTRLGIRQ